MCSQIRNHGVSPCDHRTMPLNHRAMPWARYFCPFRAITQWHIYIPKVLPWAREDIALSGRAYPGRVGVHERAESPMVSIALRPAPFGSGRAHPGRVGVHERAESPMASIAQGNALGKCIRPHIVALKGQKYLAQGNVLRFKGNALETTQLMNLYIYKKVWQRLTIHIRIVASL